MAENERMASENKKAETKAVKPVDKKEKKEKKAGLVSSLLKREKKQPAQAAKEPALKVADPWDVLKFVLMTEKCVRQIETDNQLVFIARRSADKNSIAASFEQAFKAPVKSVKTLIDQEGRKKAFIKLKEAGAAGDIAIKLGII